MENNVITVSETCVLEQTYYTENENIIYNEGDYRFNINQINFDRYYLKVNTDLYNEIAIGYNLNNSRENYNISYTNIRDAEAENNNYYYIPLDALAKNKKCVELSIDGIEDKYDDHKITFQNVVSIENNKLTYKYNNK